MSDSFSFGEPGRRRPRLDAPAPRRERRGRREPKLGRSNGSIVVAVGAAAVAVVIGFLVLSVIHSGGTAAGEAGQTAVAQIGHAQDAQAQAALQQVSAAAQVLNAEAPPGSGYDRVGAGALSAYDPALGATSGASTGPTSVSVAATATSWGAAAMSASGTCYWIHLEASATAAYGIGTPCTGQAAMTATDVGW
jgi:hypothetical protein